VADEAGGMAPGEYGVVVLQQHTVLRFSVQVQNVKRQNVERQNAE
jgi:hypothetical protein